MDREQNKWHVDVLYEDDAILVVGKPSGLLVHQGWGRDRITLVDLVRELTGNLKVYPAGRLDRGASGAILFSRDRSTARAVGAQQEGRALVKTYLALVRGCPPTQGVIDHPLPRRQGGARVPARTEFSTLATAATEPRSVSLVEARTRSGRLHQVRRHLKHLSHPLIGDANYGKGRLNRALRDRYGLTRLALHAAAIGLEHPRTGRPLRVVAPLPRDLRDPLEKMGLSAAVQLIDQR
jgi:tRNA pseudouridine65 synthase